MSSVSPSNIAVVRFSALGDVAMATPAVRNLQHSLPGSTITWITSPLGFSLLHGMPGINFAVFDKPRNVSDYRSFYRAFGQRPFDLVLAMQANLRINLLYPALHAPIKIGFDRTRAREGQWLFCNRAIPFSNSHLVDGFLAFAQAAGATPAPASWELPLSHDDRAWALAQIQHLPRPIVAVHPFASKAERNWPLQRYAAVIQSAAHDWNAGIVLTGGNSTAEHAACARLAELAPHVTLNLCGQTTPKRLTALLGEADVLVAPDTGPVHLARAMQTPVIGLYAVASPKLTGPYGQQDYIVDRYPEAVKRFLRRNPDELPWNTRVHHPEAMSLIQVEDVLQQLSRVLKTRTQP